MHRATARPRWSNPPTSPSPIRSIAWRGGPWMRSGAWTGWWPTAGSEERRVGKECRSLCDWSSDVCSSDLALVEPTDVTEPDQVDRLAGRTLDAFGRVDGLVANSGIGGPSGPLWTLTPQEWDSTFAVNVTGVFLCCKAFLPPMLERGAGAVVVMGSMTGKRPLWGRS